MRLASYRGTNGPTYGLVTDQGVIDLGRRLGARYPDLRALIAGSALDEARGLAGEAPDARLDRVEWLPVIPNPDKIVCIGLNYEEHRAETNRDKTEHPAVFLRLAESQVAHGQALLLPPESTQLLISDEPQQRAGAARVEGA
jgi:2-keto-4-pentenoate hydratase/2-oxohepta-3-ene-1,7-dioic acid hydratase in catechol pathway